MPATPRLLPGLTLLRRSRDRFQIGLSDPVVLDADQALRETFDLVSGQVVRHGDPDLVARLAARGLLVDTDAGAALRPAGGDPAARDAARDVAASVVRHGRDAARRRRRRARPVPVRLHGPAATDIADEVDRLLRRVGGRGLDPTPWRPLRSDVPARRATTVAGLPTTGEEPSPTAVLVVADGEPPRELADDLVRDGVPHLYLRVVEGTVVLGPWVSPGETACLRCDDLARAHDDPAWPLLVAQAGRLGARPRADGVPSPVETLAVAAAAASAARDLVRHAEGAAPVSAATVLTWGRPAGSPQPRDEPDVSRRQVVRHAACGCCCWELPLMTG